MKSTNIYDWLERNKDQHLTIADIQKLKIGDTLDVVFFDRNFEEHGMWDKYVKGKAYVPEDILQFNRGKVTYLGNFEWDLYFPDCGTFKHPFHLEITGLNGTNWSWSAINPEDGKIHVTNNIFDCGKEHKNWKPIHKKISEFPKTTRVGWRGPIMLWKRVYEMPKIYYD
jgi:hypothetical protein